MSECIAAVAAAGLLFVALAQLSTGSVRKRANNGSCRLCLCVY